MTDVIRETHKVNARALELGLEPPVCVTWLIRTWPDEPGIHHVVDVAQSVDSARLRAFTRMMYESGLP